MESKFSPDKLLRWFGIALVIVAVYLTVKHLSTVLLPFFIAWFFAYLLYPIVKFVQFKLRVKVRALAIIITMLLTTGVIAGVLWLIIPPMISQFDLLGKFIASYVTHQTHTHSIMAYIQEVLVDNQKQLEQFFKSPDFTNILKSALPKVFSFLGQTASVLWSIVASCIVILYMFFILLDYEYLTTKWLAIFPKKARPFWADVMHDVERALNSYIRGQGLVSLCMGIMFCIGFTIIDFPMAIGLGILIGIMNLVPYLHTFALIPTAFLALLKAADTGQNFWIIFGLAVLVFCVVQAISDTVVTPTILGKAMGLNPAVLLLALSVWGTLLGFIGLILALPLTTLIFAYWKRYVTKEDSLTQDQPQEQTT